MPSDSSLLRFLKPLPDRSWKKIAFQDRYQKEILLVFSAAFSVYLFLSLFTYSPSDPSYFSVRLPQNQISNLGGVVGAYVAGTLVYFIGVLSLVIPLPLLFMSYLNAIDRPNPFGKGRILGWLLLFLGTASILHRIWGDMEFRTLSFPIAGVLGRKIFEGVGHAFGVVGHDVIIPSLILSSTLLIGRRHYLISSLSLLTRPFVWVYRKVQVLIFNLLFRVKSIIRRSFTGKKAKIETSHSNQTYEPPFGSSPFDGGEKDRFQLDIQPISQQETPGVKVPQSPEITDPCQIIVIDQEKPLAAIDNNFEVGMISQLRTEEVDRKQYDPPPLSIFRKNELQQTLTQEQQSEFEKTANQLIKVLSDFHIEGQIIAIQPGPVVAVYEFQPKAGTKLTKVTSLMEDLALALKVDSIFIHPVTGKHALGIQVPNQKRETVYLGDILLSDRFQKAESPLTFAMGKSLSGEPICEDLASMPHLLTAGQTGSGKSVAINALLCSIIVKASPDHVRMILIDPKILELKIYEGIPHLLMPVITEATKASLAMKWACYEMDRRYQLMELAKVRHITGFNQFWDQAGAEERDEIQKLSGQKQINKLPYIVIVIDELADLMLTAPKDVESSIQRLAQKARASGIHLVLATQRPSVDVITGVIKANLPCRSSFKVFSRGDSRTILDCIGAERLLGKGDMLFLKPGSARLQRIQGAFLDDQEVVRMVDAVKSDGEPDYDEEAIGWIEEEYQRVGANDKGVEGFPMDDDDPKWDEAIAIAQSHGQISASFLQRSMKIGYNRAARMVEAMERQGLVGGADGSKPRKWLGSIIKND